MPRHALLTLSLVFASSCASQSRILTPLDLDSIDAVCDHLAALGCKEGLTVYNSDSPGPAGVPNLSCSDSYAKRMASGACINVKNLIQSTTCTNIAAAETRGCE